MSTFTTAIATATVACGVCMHGTIVAEIDRNNDRGNELIVPSLCYAAANTLKYRG